ncbi:conjugal transfer protein [Bartonella sp. CB175]|uniref:conjugal transfer protein n=1 Tax=Bartonella sp. CB175 TaxID=3112256 RepID=UPI00300E4A94
MITSTIVKVKNVKYFNALRAKIERQIGALFMTVIMFLATQSTYVHAKTNVQATVSVDTLMSMYYGLGMLVPLIAAIVFVFLLIIYLLRLIASATFARWSFSVIIAGAAFYISNILFHIN